jgi:nucleotide-binding universal stress UspA family protein
MYKNIAVAFDGSESSRAALIEAANRVRKLGGKVSLVNAVYFDEEEFSLAPDQRERRFEVGKNVCHQAKETFSSEFGIDIETLVCEGEAPDVIVEFARGKSADLIAMGTYGRRGLKRLILGSVTSGVIVNAPCDVLVVKRPCTECNGTFKSILVPFDGSEFSRKALVRACELSKTDSSEITVLYVIPRYEEMVGFFKTESIWKSLSDEAERILASARQIVSGTGLNTATVVRDGNAGEEIIGTAESLKSDLIVMGTYGWRGVDKALMGSTPERFIMNASCPVLAVI